MELKGEILWMLIKKASCQNLLTFRFGLLTCKVLVSPASFLTVRDYTARLRTHQQAEPRARRYRKAMNVFLNEAYPLGGTVIDPVSRRTIIEIRCLTKISKMNFPGGKRRWDMAGCQCLSPTLLFVGMT